MMTVERMWRGLFEKAASTAPDSDDPRLRGRTYPIPFESVWQASLTLLNGGMPRCSLLSADDQEGHVDAIAYTLFRRRPLRIAVTITLDPDAQTRVDAAIAVGGRGGDLGVGPRWLARFCRSLDKALRRRSSPAPAAREST